MADPPILVTGGTGFVGAHTIVALLHAGHDVRTTVRSLARTSAVTDAVARGGIADPGDRLTFVEADLTRDDGWAAAVDGCAYVHHVASPFPPAAPKHPDELIVPARDGALRVLRAAKAAGCKRVVMTSSYAAVGYGRPVGAADAVFTEADWTDPDAPGISAYVQSKTIAERAAWDYVSGDGAGLELAVVNPVGIFGPVLSNDYSTSVELIARMLGGKLPGLPRLAFGIVDVRDVADLHLRAMTAPQAAGERFLAISGEAMWLKQIAEILKRELGDTAGKVSTRELPDWLVRVIARVNPALRQQTSELGKRKAASNAKATGLLGWAPRSNEEAIVATAESIASFGEALR